LCRLAHTQTQFYLDDAYPERGAIAPEIARQGLSSKTPRPPVLIPEEMTRPFALASDDHMEPQRYA